MSTISRGTGAVPSAEPFIREAPVWETRRSQRPPDRPSPPVRPRDQALEQRQQQAKRDATVFTDAAELAGLGDNLEELTFGASEREEIEVHGGNQDVHERKVDEVDRLLPIEAVRELMRQLEGRPSAALLRQSAEKFASLWRQGHHEQALATLSPEKMPLAQRYAVMRMALEQMPEGEAAERLETGLRNFDPDAVGQIHRLVRVFEADRQRRNGPSPATGAGLRTLLISPPNLKLVLNTATGIGVDGLVRLEASAVRPTRVAQGASALVEVGMNLCLLRMIGQLREAQRSCGRLFDEAGGKPAGPDELKKGVEWLLDLCGAASATASRSALNRMSTAIPATADRRFSVLLQLNREAKTLPPGIWNGAEAKAHLDAALKQDIGAKYIAAGQLSVHGPVRSRL